MNFPQESERLLMRDVYKSLVGKQVTIYTKGTHVLNGNLNDFRDAILELETAVAKLFLSTDNVIAIGEVKS